MSYRVAIPASVRTRVGSLGLSNFVLVEVLLRVQALAVDPAEKLIRAEMPFDGMMLLVELIDPEDRMCQHVVVFPVFYSMDETTLHVGFPYYRREVG